MRRYMDTIVLVAVTGSLALFGASAVDAGCPGSQLLDATFSYLVSNPNWGGAGGSGSCGRNGCYETESGPPISTGMQAVYWALGTGNPATGVGNDSGLFVGGFAPGNFWIKQISASSSYPYNNPFPGGLYHYPAWVSLKLSPPYVTGPPVTWSSPDADGCGPLNPPETVCTCMMITDEWAGTGYFATLSARSDGLGNTNIDPGETIRLVEVPRPLIVSSVRNASSGDVTFQVFHTPLSGGTYQKDSCGTCLQGYKVFGQIVPRGSAAPTARSAGWTELSDATGATQPITPLGSNAPVRAECNPTLNQDLYLAIALVGEGATPFLTPHVSKNSTLVHCGQTLANPERPGNRPNEPRPGRGDRDVRTRER